jgi:hypothetical protein
METNHQTEASSLLATPKLRVYTCVGCAASHDAKNLFVGSMKALTRTNGAPITLQNLSDFAYCAKCREAGENTTLAWVIAHFETEELVSCFSCADNNKETLMPRRMAHAPGWVGCNIRKAIMLKMPGMQYQQLIRHMYVDSKELLKFGGKDGFALCYACVREVVSDFRQQARKNFGVSEEIINKKIRPQRITEMLYGVRMKEARDLRNGSNR